MEPTWVERSGVNERQSSAAKASMADLRPRMLQVSHGEKEAMMANLPSLRAGGWEMPGETRCGVRGHACRPGRRRLYTEPEAMVMSWTD